MRSDHTPAIKIIIQARGMTFRNFANGLIGEYVLDHASFRTSDGIVSRKDIPVINVGTNWGKNVNHGDNWGKLSAFSENTKNISDQFKI